MRLWSKVRLKQIHGFQFYRQRIIGNFIADFYCPSARLVIEVDGGQHYSEDMIKIDRLRDAYMQKQGLKVIRYTDTDVLTNIEGVIDDILKNIGISED